jgi:hypothetical protein
MQFEQDVVSGYNSAAREPAQWRLLRRDLHDWAIEEGLA